MIVAGIERPERRAAAVAALDAITRQPQNAGRAEQFAALFAMLEASDQAIALLSQEKNSTDNLLSLTFDPIREDPRFQVLQHRSPDQGVEP